MWHLCWLLFAGVVAGAADSARRERWWSSLRPFRLLEKNAPNEDPSCPQEPSSDLAWEMLADTGCHTTQDSASGIFLTYNITCNSNGSVTAWYVDASVLDPGPAHCTKPMPGLPMTVPEATCFALIYNTQGAKFVCDASRGNATLYGWSQQLPDVNQTNDEVPTRDAGVSLTTQTVFPPSAPFPTHGQEQNGNPVRSNAI